MRFSNRVLTMVALLACVGALGCGDNDNSAPAAQPSAALQCEVMGSLCHDADSAAGQACHELGHGDTPSQCVAEFPACITTCLGEPDHASDPLCRALGSLCHAVDDENGPRHACHELGHQNDHATCAARFDECAELCLAADDG